MVMLISVSAVLIITVFPNFIASLTRSGVKIPWITKSLIDIRGVIQFHWPKILTAVFIFILLCVFFKAKIKLFLNYISVNAPFFKNFMLVRGYSRFTRALSIMIKNGVTFSDAVPLAVKTVSNSHIASSLRQFGSLLITGKNIADSSGSIKYILPIIISMFTVGGATGDLASTVGHTASYLEKEEDNALNRFAAFIGPALIIFSALIIAYMIIGIYLPLILMYDTI
jgi:type II secretory pathway component PulF